MPGAIPVKDQLSISRHCMQELLHSAVVADNKPCLGLLAGRGNLIESSFPATALIQGEQASAEISKRFYQSQLDAKGMALMGVFQTADLEGNTDPEQTTLLRSLYEQLGGRQPRCYMVLELSHAGRLDAQAYTDPELQDDLPLELLEDGNLYPACSNC